MKKVFTTLLFIISLYAQADTKDTLALKEHQPKINLTFYERVIFNSKGVWRADQNYIGNFKILDWLRVEAGIRFGERAQGFNAYDHYKVELQSKWFYKTFRVIARLSDDVINFPSPSYRKTNELFVAEVKYPISKALDIMVGCGYVLSVQQNSKHDFLPTTIGTKNNYPIYKIALKYTHQKTELELAYGSYDVFNPYLYNQPFTQALVMYKVAKICKLQGYFRYQYNRNFGIPQNYFFSVGATFNIR